MRGDMLQKVLQNIFPLPAEVLQELSVYLKPMEYPKNYVLLRQGRICEHIYFLTKGVCRYFHTSAEGKETNVWFSLEGDALASLSSFTRQLPSQQSIQLMEDSEMFAIQRSDFEQMLAKFVEFRQMYSSFLEEEIMKMEERIYELQFLPAKERYARLLEKYPSLPQRVNLGHIASYLNITQETLSRIRADRI